MQANSSKADIHQPNHFDRWGWVLLAITIVLGYVLIVTRHLANKIDISNLDYFPLVDRAVRLSGSSLTDWVNWQHPVGFPWLVRIGLTLGFDAARWGQAIAVFGGVLGLIGTYLIAWMTSGSHKIALLVEAFTAWAGYYLLYGSYEGNDMLAAGLQLFSLGSLLIGWGRSESDNKPSIRWILLSGILAGLAFLTRYTGMITAGVSILFLGAIALRRRDRALLKALALYIAAFVIVTALQWIPTWIVTGSPLSNDQGQNVWFHVYDKHDFVTEWNEAPANITVIQVFLMNPSRFITHWWTTFSDFWLSPNMLIAEVPLKIFGQAGLIFLLLSGIAARRGVRLLLGMFVFFHLAALSLMRLDPRFLIILIPILTLGAITLFAHILPNHWRWRKWSVPVHVFAAVSGLLLAASIPLGFAAKMPATPTAMVEASDALRAAGMQAAQEVLSTDLQLQDLEILKRSRFNQANGADLPHDNLTQLLDATRAKKFRYLIYDAVTGPKLYPALIDLLSPESNPTGLTPIYIEPERAFVVYRIEDRILSSDRPRATFDQGITLQQYEVAVNHPVAEQADIRDIGVYLTWQIQRPLTESYKVFVHIGNSEGTVIAQDDGIPQFWTYPTTDWQTGQLIGDFHQIRIKIDPAITYQVVIGLYDEATADRVKLTDINGSATADQLVLQTLDIH